MYKIKRSIGESHPIWIKRWSSISLVVFDWLSWRDHKSSDVKRESERASSGDQHPTRIPSFGGPPSHPIFLDRPACLLFHPTPSTLSPHPYPRSTAFFHPPRLHLKYHMKSYFKTIIMKYVHLKIFGNFLGNWFRNLLSKMIPVQDLCSLGIDFVKILQICMR